MLLGPLGGSRFYELFLPRSIGVPANAVAEALLFVLLVAIGTANYRRADAVGRRQLKWISLALYLAVVFPLIAVVLAAYDVRFVSTLIISMASLALIPLAMLIAVWRDNLFDIDRLIGATALHSLLLGALCAFAWLEGALIDGLGLAPHTARTLLAAGACGVLAPLYLVLKPRVERIFPNEQQRLASGMIGVLAELPAASAAHDLLRSAADLLYARIGVESCAVYAGGAEGFLPIRCCGAATAAVLPRSSPLMAALANARVARSEDLLAARDAAAWPALERAALASLGMPLLVPLRAGERLDAVFCVGPRRSGIAYCAADLHWFELLRDRIAIELARRDERDAAARSHALARTLATYVPAAIARELESEQPLRQGACEVSVLFVDIRNYSGYCEPRSGAAIHAAVNAHTLWVSEVLVRHGGAVVDFSGDGLMAIFGAPRELASKESCALAAALEIATGSFGAEPAGERLAVGIGIATGETYLGHIQAFDRKIWSAVGNTTNLAARLQAKARTLDAAIVIDAATFARSRPEPQLFRRFPAQSIRGRERLEDLYAVPLRSLSPEGGSPNTWRASASRSVSLA
jgi:class 3 adenylate cyclase